jgi:hypothetical protein
MLEDQQAHSRRGIDALVYELVDRGELPFSHPLYPNIAITNGESQGEGFICAVRTIVRVMETSTLWSVCTFVRASLSKDHFTSWNENEPPSTHASDEMDQLS